MTKETAETVFMIHNLQVLQREIPIEPDPQLATMMRLFYHDIPLTIDKLKRLQELEKLVPELQKKISQLEGLINARKSNVGA